MLETHQIQLEFIDWGSGFYNCESWKIGFLNIRKPILKSSTARRIDKIFLIVFPSLSFKKVTAGWQLSDASWVLSSRTYTFCASALFFIIFLIPYFLWAFYKEHF